MSTGFWWDGTEYHKSEREARRNARSRVRIHDPQVYWDGLWTVVAGVTVLPVSALPLVDRNPDAAKALLVEARKSSVAALTELRSLVRGINPPVLVERGLFDAVHALALDATVEVTVTGTLPGRPERPVESAVYFAVAELLANVAKHAHASTVTVDLGYADRTLTATVHDDGVGGAAAGEGSGLAGLERRARAFGGTLDLAADDDVNRRVRAVLTYLDATAPAD